MHALGRRIRELRQQRGMSQAAAAEHIGVHWTYLGHLERAEKPQVSVMSIARIANSLGVTLSELFAGLEDGGELPSTGKPLRKTETAIRVGKNAIRIEKLIEELRLERATLRETVRTLKGIAPVKQIPGTRPAPGRTRKSK